MMGSAARRAGRLGGLVVNSTRQRKGNHMELLAFDLFGNLSERALMTWAVVLSGLSVIGVLWLILGMYKLAGNQVKLAAVLEGLIEAMKRK